MTGKEAVTPQRRHTPGIRLDGLRNPKRMSVAETWGGLLPNGRSERYRYTDGVGPNSHCPSVLLSSLLIILLATTMVFFISNLRRVVNVVFFLHWSFKRPMKTEQTDCSETSAQKIQTPGYHPNDDELFTVWQTSAQLYQTQQLWITCS